MKKTNPAARRKAEREYFVSPTRRENLPFSDAVRAGNTFYLSGHIGLDPQTSRPPADLEQGIHFLLDGIKATPTQTGLTMSDLVFVQIFCSDVALFEQFNAIYRTYFGEHLPARAFLGSGTLLFGARFELQGIAVK